MGFYLGASFILILFSSVLIFSYYSVAVKNTMTKAILMEKKKTFNWGLVYGFQGLVLYHHGRKRQVGMILQQ